MSLPARRINPWNVHGQVGISPCYEYDLSGNLKRVISPEEQIINSRRVDDEILTQVRMTDKAKKVEFKKFYNWPQKVKSKKVKPKKVLAKDHVPLLMIGQKAMQINELSYDKLGATSVHFEVEGDLIKVRKPLYEDVKYNTDTLKLAKSKKIKVLVPGRAFIVGKFEGDCIIFDTKESMEPPATGRGSVWRMTVEELSTLQEGAAKP